MTELPATDEWGLYEHNRPAWVAMAAPRIAALIPGNNRAELRQLWRVSKQDTKAAIWELLDATQRARIEAALRGKR